MSENTKKFSYYLPDETGEKSENETNSNAVIIIGANGSGKSKLGAWIEQQNTEEYHRIGAQRNLNFKENIPLKNFEQAEDMVLYGTEDKDQQSQKRLKWGFGKATTTTLINDFDNVLAALLALKNKENDDFVNACKEAQTREQRPDPPETVVDKLIQLWKLIFPQRLLEVKDGRFFAILPDKEPQVKYSANQMSDGERAVLYFAAQVLCVPQNMKLIIDEPEVHIHRSIMNQLWSILESYRPDCLYIYITHDTQFAAMHTASDKIWIRDYDGSNWSLEKIEDVDLPEELLFEILGNRRNVLFVEGDKGSYDTQLYTALYPHYYIVPCGSCGQVIARTKAFNKSPSLHQCKVYGLIDLDYRSEYEISKYAEDNIYTIDVAEVENLFLVEELVRLIAHHMAEDPNEVFNDVKSYVIQERFRKQIEKQNLQSVVAMIKYRLTIVDISIKSEKEAKESLENIQNAISFEQIMSDQRAKFTKALNSNDYKTVLKVFNEKSLIKTVGQSFGLKNDKYCNLVIALLNGEKHDDIVAAVSPYLPAEIPR